MRRFLAILLTAVMAASAPGLAPYEALAGVTVRSAGTVRSGGTAVKTPITPGAGVAGAGIEAIAPGAIQTNLAALDAAITLQGADPEAPAAFARKSPSLSAAKPASAVSTPKSVPVFAPVRADRSPRGPPSSGNAAVADFATAEGFAPDGNAGKDSPETSDAGGGFSLARAFGLQSVRFDGAAARGPAPLDFGAVAANGARSLRRPNLLRSNRADAPKADVEVLFAEDFIDAVRERMELKGRERWSKNEWQRLKNDVQSFVNGAGSSAVGTKRGKAVEVGVFKFKWANVGLRIFARLDRTGTQLILLDLKDKHALLDGGEAAYYEELAERVESGGVSGYGFDALPKSGRNAFEKLRLPERAITARFKKAKTIYGWRNEVREAEAREKIEEADPRNAADRRPQSAKGTAGEALDFDPEFEIGSEAEAAGVREPRLDGTLDAAAYKVPAGIRFKRAGYLAAHYAGIAAFAAFLGLGLGWLPAALGFGAAAAGVIGGRVASNLEARNGASAFVPEGTTEADLLDLREELVRLQGGEAMSEEELSDLDARSQPLTRFLEWAEGATQVLVNRAGFDGYRAPRLWYNESHSDPYAAHSSLGDLDRSSSLYIGVGFLLRPLGETLGMMAHEIGHLYHGDYGFLRERFRLNPGGQGFNRGVRFATGIAIAATVASAALYGAAALIQGAALAVDPVSAAVSAGWMAAAFASAFVSLIAGFAATRQDEFRADAFSAWLTHPQWWISWLRMRRASRERAEARAEERSGLSRLWDRLMSTHPDYDSRIELLESLRPGSEVLAVPALPASASVYGLNGETTVVLKGLDQNALETVERELKGPFEAQVFFVEEEGAPTGLTVVRLHRTDRVRLDAAVDGEAVDALLSAVRADYPEAAVVSSASRPHEVFRWAKKSRTARRVLSELNRLGVPIRWDTTLGIGDERGIFRPEGESGPEILINPAVFFKSSPKALLAVIAHEAYHAMVHARMRRIGIDWLDLGGMEFERLAHSTGLRVFRESGGDAHDDIDAIDGGAGYAEQLARWSSLSEDAHIEHLRERGYGQFARLSDLRSASPEDIAAELGIDEDPASVEAKLQAFWKFYESERNRESRWRFWSFLR
jgi:hypothetical protein